MIEKMQLEQAAKKWIDSWNNQDIENIMSHYADDVVLYSPTVIRRWAKPEGKLEGKADLESHFRKGLEEIPNMRFEYHSMLYGAASIILFYKRETGLFAADMVRFNEAGKVVEVRTYYEEKTEDKK